MPQAKSKAIRFAPAETGEKRLDLSIEDDQAIVKLSSWVEGLGWCGEKTMILDEDLLGEMHRMIGAARLRLRDQRSADTGKITSNKVLKFPTTV